VPWKYITTSVGVDITGVSTILDNQDDEGNGEVGVQNSLGEMSKPSEIVISARIFLSKQSHLPKGIVLTSKSTLTSKS